MSSISEQFLKSKDIADLCKVNFCIKKLFIQCITGSCCAHITGGVNIYLYVCVSTLVPVCPACVCLRVIPNQSTRKNHVIRGKASVHWILCCINTQQGAKVPKLNKFSLGP